MIFRFFIIVAIFFSASAAYAHSTSFISKGF